MSNENKTMKKKNYEVLVTGLATVLVIGAKSEAQALEFAGNMGKGDFQTEEMRITREVTQKELESARRCADYVDEEE